LLLVEEEVLLEGVFVVVLFSFVSAFSLNVPLVFGASFHTHLDIIVINNHVRREFINCLLLKCSLSNKYSADKSTHVNQDISANIDLAV